MGSPCCVPLFEVFPPLMTHDSWLFSSTSIHSTNSVRKPIFPSIAIKKRWLTESNAFSISTLTRIPLFETSLLSRRSVISLPPTLLFYFHICILIWRYYLGKTLLRRSVKALEISFTSMWSRPFFSINFVTACFYDVLSCFTK